MSRYASQSSKASSRGRYNIPTTNMMEPEDDPPEYEPFDEAETGATPRSSGDDLSVTGVDMCLETNKSSHNTYDYDNDILVLRRGQGFLIQISFNRILTDSDDFQLEFMIGSNPSVDKGSLVCVPIGNRSGGGSWSGQIVEHLGDSVVLSITSTPKAIVGKFRTYVAIAGYSGLHRTPRDTSTDFYMLFNVWCPDDEVYMDDEGSRWEYVMSDYGIIYQGEASAVNPRSWVYGQFEKGILDSCIYVLDSSRMPIFDRGNPIKVVRKGSAMMNSQDDNGMMIGNWSDDYSMGTSPLVWTGSVSIMQQYTNSGTPVSYAQCWVFAGVFNTFMRCLGLPSRVVTNFSSAHDNTGNLKTDLIFKPDGTPDEAHTRDSIWNFHCWNEVNMIRPDLPHGMGGWQAVDATPQETSDGHYRCGPSSVAAIKEGVLCHPYDACFVFAEVNSDVIYQKRNKYGDLTPYKVDKTCIGQCMLTKGVNTDSPYDITHTYKYPEGSHDDARCMASAEQYGADRHHFDVPQEQLSVQISAENAMHGQDFNITLQFQNLSAEPLQFDGKLCCSVVFYTGIVTSSFKHEPVPVALHGNQAATVTIRIKSLEYMPYIGSQKALKFTLIGDAGGQSVTIMKVVMLKSPPLELKVGGESYRHQETVVTLSFTNTFSYQLNNVVVIMEAPGLFTIKKKSYSQISPFATITWTESFYPWKLGARRIVAVLDCKTLSEVWGTVDLVVHKEIGL